MGPAEGHRGGWWLEDVTFAACGEKELGGDLTACGTTEDTCAEEKKPAQGHRETREYVALREILMGHKTSSSWKCQALERDLERL